MVCGAALDRLPAGTARVATIELANRDRVDFGRSRSTFQYRRMRGDSDETSRRSCEDRPAEPGNRSDEDWIAADSLVAQRSRQSSEPLRRCRFD